MYNLNKDAVEKADKKALDVFFTKHAGVKETMDWLEKNQDAEDNQYPDSIVPCSEKQDEWVCHVFSDIKSLSHDYQEMMRYAIDNQSANKEMANLGKNLITDSTMVQEVQVEFKATLSLLASIPTENIESMLKEEAAKILSDFETHTEMGEVMQVKVEFKEEGATYSGCDMA